jgi:hypothetical protein
MRLSSESVDEVLRCIECTAGHHHVLRVVQSTSRGFGRGPMIICPLCGLGTKF